MASFSDDDLLALEAQAQVLQRRTGDLVHGYGDNAEYSFILAAGAVKISRPSRRAQDVNFDILGPPTVFGAVSGSVPRTWRLETTIEGTPLHHF